MKVSRASCGGQRIPSASSAGNPRPTIIWGRVLSVKHVVTFTFYFQNPLGIYQLKEICISVRTDSFVGICSFLCRCYPKFGKESKSGGLRKKCMMWEGTFDDWHPCYSDSLHLLSLHSTSNPCEEFCLHCLLQTSMEILSFLWETGWSQPYLLPLFSCLILAICQLTPTTFHLSTHRYLLTHTHAHTHTLPLSLV